MLTDTELAELMSDLAALGITETTIIRDDGTTYAITTIEPDEKEEDQPGPARR